MIKGGFFWRGRIELMRCLAIYGAHARVVVVVVVCELADLVFMHGGYV